MQLRVYKRIYLTPFVRLNTFTGGFSISFGHRRIGWITFSKRGIRETLHTSTCGVHLKANDGTSWQGHQGGRRTGICSASSKMNAKESSDQKL